MVPPASVSPVELLRLHQAQIRRLVRRLAGSDAVDDVEQEVYVAALERPPRERVALPAWIATTVRNLVAKRLRSRARRQAREQIAATPEQLPASSELVARVELEEFVLHCVRELPEPERDVILLRFFEGRSPTAIAQQLGLGESTVRARQQRGIERLRERLDARTGSRERWVRALVPVTALPTIKVAAIAAGLVAAGAFSLVTILQQDSPVESVTWTFGVGAPGSDGGEGDATSLAPAPAVSAAAVDRSPESPPSSSPASPFPDPELAQLGPPGRVKLNVVDAESGADIPDADVRFMSATRFAQLDRGAVLDRAVSAGTWSMSVLRDGYEPEVRDGIVVAAGATTDLGTIALARGGGAIQGRLRSDEVDPKTPRFVELRGSGRSPCPRCGHASDPPCCGFGPDRSLLPIGADGTFLFRGLAAGTYFVRPLDDQPRLQPTLRLELAHGEWREVELTLAPPVVAVLELVDEQGDPFVGIWENDRDETTATIHVDLEVDDVRTGFDIQPEPETVRRRLGPPRLAGTPVPSSVATEAASAAPSPALQTLVFSWFARRDRPFAEGDTLVPHVDTPFFAELQLACGRMAPNVYFVHDLPATHVRVKAQTGLLSAAELDVDFADPGQRQIRLVFRRPER